MARLTVTGARQHNLKNISCEIPRDRLVAFTGPSGSGKSSLAFDTIYAEAQRLYLEALPAAARRGTDHLPRPELDEITGLSPAIALRQALPTRNPRSTVGTVTEIADYLRVLFARGAQAHCPVGGESLRAYSAQQMVDKLEAQPVGTRLTLLAPLHRRAPIEELRSTVQQLRESGYVRVRYNGVTELIEELQIPEHAEMGDLDLVVDRLVLREGLRTRLSDSVELALREGRGTIAVDTMDGTTPQTYSETLHCAQHQQTLPKPEPALFSFNTRLGACPACTGLGVQQELVSERLVPNGALSLRQGALAPLGRPGSLAYAAMLDELVRATGVDPDVPWTRLPTGVQQQIIGGDEPIVRAKGSKPRARSPVRSYAGLKQLLSQFLEQDAADEPLEGALSPSELSSFFRSVPCRTCDATRLTPNAQHFRFGGHTYAELSSLPIATLASELSDPQLAPHLSTSERTLLHPLIRSITSRARFLVDVGLGYLSLSSALSRLSTGEARRLMLASQLGAPLVGVLYVLDEPSLGLHPGDLEPIRRALQELVARGNSVFIVEHERSLILAADWVLDMGPGAGTHGGTLVAEGSIADLRQQVDSVTAPFLDGRKTLTRPGSATHAPSSWLRVMGARAGNLKNVDVAFPEARVTAVTGVSGSGKSSLVIETLLPALRAALRGSPPPSELCDAVQGAEGVTRVVALDQNPLGRSARSNPATYTGLMTLLRELFAALPESRTRGFRASRFSFNIKGGRCETCKGEGVQRLEFQLLADVSVPCPDCNGTRFNRETLEPRYKGLNIAEILALTVDQATALFVSMHRILAKLVQLQRVGLGYLQLGQAAPTLSGGEAQRVRLAAELSRSGLGHTLYLLDEATAGLHFQDVQVVCDALFALRDEGHTLILVEHNMDVVRLVDWVIDLGPGAGEAGGSLLHAGTPSSLMDLETATARALKNAE